MILGITEDFSTNITLDAELTSLPSSGLYLNSGVHPSITVNNLLSFLSFEDITISDYDEAKQYHVYSVTKSKSDLVLYQGIIYQSLTDNLGSGKPNEAPENWMPTNIESLKLKNFISKVEDKVYSDLRLTKRLINNQFIYNLGKVESMLPNDYSAWVFEPKGSDYVTITLNQVSIQKSGTTPINMYVINQGVIVDTLAITPNNGKVDFQDLNFSFSGKGKWIFAIDSTEVFTTTSYVDMLQYDGFICYTASGIGNSPETATYSDSIIGNGIGFNVSVELNSQLYIDNNISLLGNFVRATFELMALEMFLFNSENRSNRVQQIQLDRDNLIAETKSLEMNTVARRYTNELSIARKTIAKTFDTQLSVEISDFEIDETSI